MKTSNLSNSKITTMKHHLKNFALVTATLLASGCATSSKDVAPTYVSPLLYSSYDCQQLAGETQRLSIRYNQLAERIDTAAENDKKLAVTGALFFFPIFFIGGNKDREQEYSRLKGEYDALHQTAVQKKCAGAVNATPSN